MGEKPPSRVRLRNTGGGGGGEIVEVAGGHIVRSTGRKDRHSKVCTAKGPRDRRVRLAAHTAIQFYDVQDRLGYDRPSKAVDWLIKKAKSSIDELAQLPPWHPTNTSSSSAPNFRQPEDHNSGQHEQQHHDSSSFLPPSLDSDAIADTIKSFFPTGASADATSSAMQFHNSQDLRLSLQSFAQDSQQHIQGQVLLSGIPLGFDGTGSWAAEHHQQQQQAAELSRYHRHAAASWNSGGGVDGAAAAGYLFNSNSPQLQQLLVESQNQFHQQQRGPLQSSNTPAIRAWMDPSTTADHGGGQQQYHHHLLPIYPPSISGAGFSSGGGGGGFSGFHIPARFQGEEEEHDGYPDKPSSASSDSRH